MARVAEQISIPIATGERFINLYQFQTLLTRNAVQYLRPDVCLCGGITGAKKIAAMAEAHDAWIVQHNPLSPVSTAACLQIAACIPNFAIQEYPSRTPDIDGGRDLLGNDLATGLAEQVGGFIAIPDAPGIGLELVDDIERRFPPKPPPIRMRAHLDGSVVDMYEKLEGRERQMQMSVSSKRVFHSSNLQIVIWPDANEAPNSMAAVSADGSEVWVFDPAYELFMETVFCSRLSIAPTRRHSKLSSERGAISDRTTPDDIYERPRTMFVASFSGNPAINLFEGELRDEAGRLVFRGGNLVVPIAPEQAAQIADARRSVVLGLRAEDVGVGEPDAPALLGRVDTVMAAGSDLFLGLKVEGLDVFVRVDKNASVREGEEIALGLIAARLHLFDRETGRSLYAERAA